MLIEATIQDLYVEADLKKIKKLALTCLAIDKAIIIFNMAEDIFNEMIEIQKECFHNFK